MCRDLPCTQKSSSQVKVCLTLDLTQPNNVNDTNKIGERVKERKKQQATIYTL